jgi:hypothetical protein
MAKILTNREMADIVNRAITEEGLIDEVESYRKFLFGLADLICEHFGGSHGSPARAEESGLGWICPFYNEEGYGVPNDGGVFSAYDRDVVWKDGEEQ